VSLVRVWAKRIERRGNQYNGENIRCKNDGWGLDLLYSIYFDTPVGLLALHDNDIFS
jgi:hypothetical protein